MTHHTTPVHGAGGRLLAVALDSGDPDLVERGIADGWLPNMRRLREQGAYGRLASSADWLGGSPWPTFYTGTGPEEHGMYHWQQWRPDKMWLYRCDPAWLPMEPFWRAWGRDQPRVVALDLPMAYGVRPFNGIEIVGWASHDQIVPAQSTPPEALRRVDTEFGRCLLDREVYERQSLAELLAIRDDLVALTDRVGHAAYHLLRTETWDMFFLTFGATHRGGHKLWDHTGVREVDVADAMESLPAALRDVYVACDTAIGRLIDAAGPDVAVMVFSLHGMGPNTCRLDILDEMLSRVVSPPPVDDTAPGGADVAVDPSDGGRLERLRELVPERYRSLVKDNLPLTWQEALTRFWRRRKFDWSATKALLTESDPQGYIRINLRGRERRGIVQPGREFDALCTQIEQGLRSFVDADTGEPMVAEIARRERLYATGVRKHLLPDLIVRWCDTPAAQHRAVRSDRFGTILWPTPGRHPTGRSGNHRGEGYLIARAPAFAPGAAITNAHILDLAPTIHDLLGIDTPGHMQGCSLLPSQARVSTGVGA